MLYEHIKTTSKKKTGKTYDLKYCQHLALLMLHVHTRHQKSILCWLSDGCSLHDAALQQLCCSWDDQETSSKLSGPWIVHNIDIFKGSHALYGKCGDKVSVGWGSGPALPHSHSPLRRRYDKLCSLSENIIAHSSYFTLQINVRMVYQLNVDYFMLLTNSINYTGCSIPSVINPFCHFYLHIHTFS